MAPFSICSKCKVRTRKVIKDPVTLKDIYLCPKCCKAKNEALAKENALEKKGRRDLKEQPPANEPKKPTATTDDPEPEPEPEPKPAVAPKQPVAPVAAAPPSRTPIRKCTPPIMQTVVINGRKYIALTDTCGSCMCCGLGLHYK